jgi:hypothetical protein
VQAFLSRPLESSGYAYVYVDATLSGLLVVVKLSSLAPPTPNPLRMQVVTSSPSWVSP